MPRRKPLPALTQRHQGPGSSVLGMQTGVTARPPPVTWPEFWREGASSQSRIFQGP